MAYTTEPCLLGFGLDSSYFGLYILVEPGEREAARDETFFSRLVFGGDADLRFHGHGTCMCGQ